MVSKHNQGPISQHAIAKTLNALAISRSSISQHAIATPKPAIAGNFPTCSRAEGFFCNSALRVGIADCKIANCKIAVLNRVHVDCRIADCELHVVKSAPDV
ncbi:hypothetical protein L596_012496 [Steinernema carpocapsae]|uniref:Uncharacterized protein n=1 Tax=Steinernema carpocapsae TaxID=34508 RepID=A0A4U5NXF9_STECR|nr:hypothetical protein L596_012496 [Steinernema carpocapsae]